MDASATVTSDVNVPVFDDSLSVQVHSSPALDIVYKDKASRMKKKSQYLQSPYFDYAGVNRKRNDLFKEYVAFKVDKK